MTCTKFVHTDMSVRKILHYKELNEYIKDKLIVRIYILIDVSYTFNVQIKANECCKLQAKHNGIYIIL